MIPAINQRENKKGKVKFYATIKNDVGKIDESNEKSSRREFHLVRVKVFLNIH